MVAFSLSKPVLLFRIFVAFCKRPLKGLKYIAVFGTHTHTHTHAHAHIHIHAHTHTDTHPYTRELRGTEHKNVLMNTRTQRHRIQAHAHKHVRSNLGYVREDSRSDVIAKTKALQAYAGVNRPVTTDLHFSSPGNLKEKQEVKLSPPRA